MKNKLLILIIAGVAAAIAAAVVILCLGKGGEDAVQKQAQSEETELMVNGEPKSELYYRMHDEEYLKELDELETKRSAALADMTRAKTALDEARAAGAGAEALTRLENTLRDATARIQQIREETQARVRKQLLRETEQK